MGGTNIYYDGRILWLPAFVRWTWIWIIFLKRDLGLIRIYANIYIHK